MIVAMLCCHVRRYMRVCHLLVASQIVLTWLHRGCDGGLSADVSHFGADSFKNSL